MKCSRATKGRACLNSGKRAKPENTGFRCRVFDERSGQEWIGDDNVDGSLSCWNSARLVRSMVPTLLPSKCP